MNQATNHPAIRVILNMPADYRCEAFGKASRDQSLPPEVRRVAGDAFLFGKHQQAAEEAEDRRDPFPHHIFRSA